MPTEITVPPAVLRAADAAGLGQFRARHDRRAPWWRRDAEMAMALAPVLMFLFVIPSWEWRTFAAGVALLAIAVVRDKRLSSPVAKPPRVARATDVGTLAAYAAVLAGYVAHQRQTGGPGAESAWLATAVVIGAAGLVVAAVDVAVVDAPWYRFRGGLVVASPRNRVRRVVRWSDVTTLWYDCWRSSWTDRQFEDLGARPSWQQAEQHRHRLVVDGGRSMRISTTELSSGLEDDLGRGVRSGVALAQCDAVLAEIRGGGRVRFGPIEADAEGLRTEGVSLPWSTVRNIVVRDRMLTISSTANPSTLKVPARQVPNSPTLGELAGRLRSTG